MKRFAQVGSIDFLSQSFSLSRLHQPQPHPRALICFRLATQTSLSRLEFTHMQHNSQFMHLAYEIGIWIESHSTLVSSLTRHWWSSTFTYTQVQRRLNNLDTFTSFPKKEQKENSQTISGKSRPELRNMRKLQLRCCCCRFAFTSMDFFFLSRRVTVCIQNSCIVEIFTLEICKIFASFTNDTSVWLLILDIFSFAFDAIGQSNSWDFFRFSSKVLQKKHLWNFLFLQVFLLH